MKTYILKNTISNLSPLFFLLISTNSFNKVHGNGIRNIKYRWPNATVPYIIENSRYDSKQLSQIQEAAQIINKVSCINIRSKTEKDEQYVLISNELTPPEHVGYLNIVKQHLNLDQFQMIDKHFEIGIILHKFLHILGFFPMENDNDRDYYVTIKWENIKPSDHHLFKINPKYIAINFGYPYDYASVMHSGSYAYSKNGQKTIVPMVDAIIGKRKELSPLDIKKLNAMYHC